MKEKIEERLKQLTLLRDETIFEAARYALLSPGKRLRPLLTLASAAVFGADPYSVLDPACAIEMIHAYSLIHDDLPCMDNDDLRRGLPTLHKVYGEAMALLTGDYLLTYAFEVIANTKELSAEQKLQMIQVVSNRAGAPGMIGGQALDIEAEGKEIDEDTLLQMHYGKTAALFTACLECGAIAANCSNPLLASIGLDLGLAYQLQDDLLNATSTTAILGKTAHSDAAKQKATAITLFGITATKERLVQLERSLFSKLQLLPRAAPELFTLVQKIFQRIC